MKFKLFTFTILFLLSANGYSQGLYPKSQAGLGFSNISGGLINWQLELNPAMGFKLGTLVFYNSDNPPNELELYGNLGVEWQYNIYKDYNKRLYGLIGLSYWYLQNKNYSEEVINDVKYITIDNNIKKLLNSGIGLGYEYKLHPQFAIGLDIGLFLQSKLSGVGTFIWLIDRAQSNGSAVGLSVGIGFRYVFY